MLSTDVDVVRDDLTTGVVPQGTELVIVLEPTDLSETQVFALDRFLMRGGTIVVATAPCLTTIGRDTLLANHMPVTGVVCASWGNHCAIYGYGSAKHSVPAASDASSWWFQFSRIDAL